MHGQEAYPRGRNFACQLLTNSKELLRSCKLGSLVQALGRPSCRYPCVSIRDTDWDAGSHLLRKASLSISDAQRHDFCPVCCYERIWQEPADSQRGPIGEDDERRPVFIYLEGRKGMTKLVEVLSPCVHLTLAMGSSRAHFAQSHTLTRPFRWLPRIRRMGVPQRKMKRMGRRPALSIGTEQSNTVVPLFCVLHESRFPLLRCTTSVLAVFVSPRSCTGVLALLSQPDSTAKSFQE